MNEEQNRARYKIACVLRNLAPANEHGHRPCPLCEATPRYSDGYTVEGLDRHLWHHCQVFRAGVGVTT